MARDMLTIYNEAIADVPADPVDSVDDTRKSGVECRRFIGGVISDLLALHDWTWAKRRVALAEVANDREEEWAYAYAMPADMAGPIGVLPNYTESGGGLYLTPYWCFPEARIQRHSDRRLPYQIFGDVLYTDLAEAKLDYSVDDILPQSWPSLFSKAVVDLLTSRIYRPILGADADAQALREKRLQAEYSKSEAVADDLNRGPRWRDHGESEMTLARLGGCAWRL